jgi:polyisoprenyl-teichoic acid--peptidoglycan teichoic acid transferase
VVGVSAGFGFLMFTGKPHNAALSNSLTTNGQVLTAQAVQNPASIFSGVLPSLDQRTTILLMGVDSNGKDCERWVGTRSDTMILLNLDPHAHRVSVVSIPRDTKVKVANNHGTNKINAAHALGGPQLAVATIRESFGVPIDHYVGIDTSGLKKLFEELGPVEVYVEKAMKYRDRAGHLNVDLQPGRQVLDPVQAEEYVRFRHDAMGDIGRIERQQWFLRQVAHKVKEPQVLLKLPALVSFMNDYVETDLAVDDMARIYSFLKDFDPKQVETAMLPGTPATIGGCSYWVHDPDASQIVFSKLLGVAPQIDLAAYDETAEPAIVPVVDTTKPLSVAIKYPRGAEEVARRMETLLTNSGFDVRYKWQVASSDCSHSQIVENSGRPDAQTIAGIYRDIPDLAGWPVVLSVQSRPDTDLTLVISPESSLITASAPYTPAAVQAVPLANQ